MMPPPPANTKAPAHREHLSAANEAMIDRDMEEIGDQSTNLPADEVASQVKGDMVNKNSIMNKTISNQGDGSDSDEAIQNPKQVQDLNSTETTSDDNKSSGREGPDVASRELSEEEISGSLALPESSVAEDVETSTKSVGKSKERKFVKRVQRKSRHGFQAFAVSLYAVRLAVPKLTTSCRNAETRIIRKRSSKSTEVSTKRLNLRLEFMLVTPTHALKYSY